MPAAHAILELFPGPGEWTEPDYFFLEDRGRLVELADGNVEVLPRPTWAHHLAHGRLYKSLSDQDRLGAVALAPMPVRLWPGRIREPDLAFMLPEHYDRIGKYWGVPDIAVEATTAETSANDRGIKRADYERAGVQEYWIVDPELRMVEIIHFGAESRAFGEDDELTSRLLPGWSIPLRELFAPER